MPLAKNIKEEVISQFQINKTDTGSSSVQVALLTHSIQSLTKHLQANRKDQGTRRALIKQVEQRKKHLKYLNANDNARYRDLLKQLDLRK